MRDVPLTEGLGGRAICRQAMVLVPELTEKQCQAKEADGAKQQLIREDIEALMRKLMGRVGDWPAPSCNRLMKKAWCDRYAPDPFVWRREQEPARSEEAFFTVMEVPAVASHANGELALKLGNEFKEVVAIDAAKEQIGIGLDFARTAPNGFNNEGNDFR